MRRVNPALFFCLALISGSTPHTAQADAHIGRNSIASDLMVRYAAFGDYADHFSRFAESVGPTDRDSVVVADLEGEADLASELLFAAFNDLGIYDELSCPADRARIKPIIATLLRYYSDEFAKRAIIVSKFGMALHHTEIANESRKMEADLRSAKERLDAIGASLP